MSVIEEIAIAVGLDIGSINKIIDTAPLRYKVFQIPKRTSGTRTIAQPSRELKAIQRFILHQKLELVAPHPAAMGYVAERGIRMNAEAHRHNPVILKLDFESFFPSIRTQDWRILAKSIYADIVPVNEIGVYARLLFWGAGTRTPICLSIGAPTSPYLSNMAMLHFDAAVQSFIAGKDIVYTRYADDLTISGASVKEILEAESFVRSIVRSLKSPRLSLNEKKRGLYLRGQRRMVTGLIITPDGDVSLGRERKRMISSLIHRAALSQLDADQLMNLKGLLAFCADAEPEFLTRLRSKYGTDIVSFVMAFDRPILE